MKFLRHLDRYAPKVELNLNGKTQQKSSFGGFISILSYLTVFAYGMTLLNRLAHRSDPQITTYDVITDLTDLGKVTAEEINFDLAIQFRASLGDELNIPLAEIETYFTVQINITTVKNYSFIKSERKTITNPYVSCYDEVNGDRPFKFVDKEVLATFLQGASCINNTEMVF